MTRARTLLVVSAVLAAALVLLVQWRQAQFEREARELEAEREKLAAQITELTERRDLLREMHTLAASKEFYVVLFRSEHEAQLRLEDRTLRRVRLRRESPLPPPGRYRLQSAEPTVLDWNGVAIVPADASETSGCPATAGNCLVVAADDFAALARLKLGTVLVVLP